jgi:hypothetical protein
MRDTVGLLRQGLMQFHRNPETQTPRSPPTCLFHTHPSCMCAALLPHFAASEPIKLRISPILFCIIIQPQFLHHSAAPESYSWHELLDTNVDYVNLCLESISLLLLSINCCE